MTGNHGDLADQHCVSCRRDSPKVELDEAIALLQQLPEWNLVEREGIPRLERQYHFSDYLTALAFVQRLGEFAERENHHPVMSITPRRVTVTWWTHAIKNLHHNDFVMAAKTDRIASSS